MYLRGAFGSLFASRFRKVVFLVVVLLVVLTVGVYAYIASLPPPRGPRASITSPPLEFAIELDKAEYGYGENITITFLLKNISNQTIQVEKLSMWSFGSSEGGILITEADRANITYPIAYPPEGAQHLLNVLFHFGFSITDQNGTEVFKEYKGTAQAIYAIAIEPGGYVRQILILGIEFFNGELFFQKGTYQIRGIQYCGVPFSERFITLETPSIMFTVK